MYQVASTAVKIVMLSAIITAVLGLSQTAKASGYQPGNPPTYNGVPVHGWCIDFVDNYANNVLHCPIPGIDQFHSPEDGAHWVWDDQDPKDGHDRLAPANTIRLSNDGSSNYPQSQDIIVWRSSFGAGYGHIAIVDVANNRNDVWVVDSNFNYPFDFLGRRHQIKIDSNILGWFRKQGTITLPASPSANGSFVVYKGNVYHIAGGAPVYVGSWNTYGGPQPTIALSDAQWAALPWYPTDGTFVVAEPSGQVFRFAGGAPIYVGSWSIYSGPQPSVVISDDDVKNAGSTDPSNPWSHVRFYPADGTFVAAEPSGQVFRFAGGAPIYVGSWNIYGSPQPSVVISDDDMKNAGSTDLTNPWSHVRFYPADGTFVVAQPSGQVFRFAGGAPIYVGSWSIYGGAQPTVTISDGDVINAGSTDPTNPWSHVRFYPADGTFIVTAPSGRVYRVNAGFPLYVPSWNIYGGPQPTVGISDDDITNAGATASSNPWSHLK